MDDLAAASYPSTTVEVIGEREASVDLTDGGVSRTHVGAAAGPSAGIGGDNGGGSDRERGSSWSSTGVRGGTSESTG